MNSILAVALLIAILLACNLSDKPKPSDNANSANANSNAREKTVEPDNQKPGNANTNNPARDRDALKAELMEIEYKVTTASFAGDTATLGSFVADDYVGTLVDGSTQNKKQLLAGTQPDTVTKDWRITDGELVSSSEDSAVLTYVQTQKLKKGQTIRARVTDTFVKRNGRWLVKSEQQTLMK